MEKYTALITTTIKTNPDKVWEALTKPEIIKQYLFGVEVVTDWQVGNPITYKGQWEGKTFEDKGKIIKIEPGKLLAINYWSSFFDLPDSPENYQLVTYILSPENGGTKLEISQENIGSEEAKNQSEQNWRLVLDELKKILEK